MTDVEEEDNLVTNFSESTNTTEFLNTTQFPTIDLENWAEDRHFPDALIPTWVVLLVTGIVAVLSIVTLVLRVIKHYKKDQNKAAKRVLKNAEKFRRYALLQPNSIEQPIIQQTLNAANDPQAVNAAIVRPKNVVPQQDESQDVTENEEISTEDPDFEPSPNDEFD